MPGKVNPVIPEALNQIAFKVFGADTTVAFAVEAGQLQLNAFEPLILWSIHEAVDLLVAGIDMTITHCLDGLAADEAGCAANLARNAAMATELVPPSRLRALRRVCQGRARSARRLARCDRQPRSQRLAALRRARRWASPKLRGARRQQLIALTR